MRRIASLALVALLAGCSGGDRPPAGADAEAAKPRQKTVFDDQLKALDKARAVEGELQKAKEQQDRTIDEQGG